MTRPNDNTQKDADSPDSPPEGFENVNVFDDEFALDPDEDDFMPSVSDGFRPTNLTRTSSSGSATNPKPTSETDLRRVATRNSTAKSPFANRDTTPAPRLPPPSTSMQNRDSMSSTASFATTAQSELGTGPSHPYAMYAQNTMVRSPSISTAASTHQPPESPVAMQRPTHPYGMYTQNVVVEDEPPVPQVQNSIPLGFTGLNASVGTGYRRQIGPDGEEQDIIGPDGHTEQLPPYSRYPEEGPTKASLAAEASATSVGAIAAGPNLIDESNDTLLATSASPSPSSPVSPIAHAIPPPATITPALLPQQRPETQTGNTAAPRAPTTSESASLLTSDDDGVLNEKTASISNKQIPWRKRKLWGKIPVTMALMAVALLLVFAVVLGAAMGTVIAKQTKDDDDDEKKSKPRPEDPLSQNAPSNTFFDATPIPTPTNLASLPDGQFSLPLGFAQESSPGCLVQGNQYAAWSCKMSFAPLVLTVVTGEDKFGLSLESFLSADGSIQYGLQPPLAYNQSLHLVTDLDYKGYGPAWHFSTVYDKVVVLTPDEFTAGSSFRPRQNDNKSYRHRFQVQPGDNPWLCFWNSTYIEGYIYVQTNSTAATVSGYPTPNPTDPFGPMQFPSTGAGFPSPTSTTTVPIPTSTTSTGSAKRKRDENSPPFPRLPPYPRTVKIEERRLPNGPQPYCQKMQLLDNGQLSPVTNSNGDKIVVRLQEQDPSIDEYTRDRSIDPSPTTLTTTTRKRARLDRRRDPPDACHCQWMFQ
ncbi:unnamed protein product [Periconia digitata]|uniref:DUF7820 domain-containing protein n=1 Tax=Periconia digitata TaxID=1303443 RepID=A0A9W4UT90_9PLEO|nr:unnamed protein product [Periconia digitata]